MCFFVSMKVLGIETSSDVGSVAICDEENVVFEQSLNRGMRHGKELIATIKSLFDKNNLKPNDISLIAVSVGPGSYTGLRVGITAAKILSFTLQKPVIDVSSMDVLAQNIKERYKFICPIIDAKRKMVYVNIYEYFSEDQLRFFYVGDRNGIVQNDVDNKILFNLWRNVSGLMLISPYEIADKLQQGTVVFGDGVLRYTEIFANKGLLIENSVLGIPKASTVAVMGKHAYENGKKCNVDSLKPTYLRKPEALELSIHMNRS